eukprot:TRINITY_DN45878_c0_g1_i1.p2 TRINITY_DN45878_c0_g1~~TRINITY_DN45878_c0_g1_i1.p2  ORF type:complete len:107 (+),score=41.17 TRINITY_DN45878_c0_g1_i1:123-443(+)
MFVFFFFNDTATTEIYTRSIVGSVRCVQETEKEQRKGTKKVIKCFQQVKSKEKGHREKENQKNGQKQEEKKKKEREREKGKTKRQQRRKNKQQSKRKNKEQVKEKK